MLDSGLPLDDVKDLRRFLELTAVIKKLLACLEVRHTVPFNRPSQAWNMDIK